MTEEPLKTIGLTDDAKQVLATLMAEGVFKEETDVAKLAIAHAVGVGMRPEAATNVGTKWAVGNFDATGLLQDLARTHMPDVEPTRALRDLVNAGLSDLKRRYWQDGSWDLSAVVSARS